MNLKASPDIPGTKGVWTSGNISTSEHPKLGLTKRSQPGWKKGYLHLNRRVIIFYYLKNDIISLDCSIRLVEA